MPFTKGHKINLGKKWRISEEAREKLIQRAIGRKASRATRLKMSRSAKGKHSAKRSSFSCEKHTSWKGEQASYGAKHTWIANHYGKALRCENLRCESESPKRYEWANLSGRFRDIADYLQLCPSCHRRFDLGYMDINGITKPVGLYEQNIITTYGSNNK